MSARYSADYVPLLPVLPVTSGYGGERPQIGPFDGIVDTGADATIVPEDIPQRLKATPLNPGQLETQWGDVHPVTIYLLDIEIDGHRLPGIIVAGDPESGEVVLGRSVLNTLALFLDGPGRQTDILDDATVKRLRTLRSGKSGLPPSP